MRVLVAGHLCIDLFVELDDQPGLEAGHLYDVGAMTPRLGGAVATTGEALRTLGLDVAAAATVGDDHLAVVLTQLLEQAGMDTSQLSRTHLPSSFSIVAQPPGRDRTFWHCTGANDAFTGAELDLDGIDLLHVGYPSLLPGLLADGGEALTVLLTRAREQGIVTSVDLAVVDPRQAGSIPYAELLARWLPLIDVLSPSLDDLTSALGWELEADPAGLADAAERLVGMGVGVAAVTGGQCGIAVCTGDRVDQLALPGVRPTREFVPTVPARRIVTTTGAGDIATAGLLHGLCTGAGVREAAEGAVRVAARHVAGDPLN